MLSANYDIMFDHYIYIILRNSEIEIVVDNRLVKVIKCLQSAKNAIIWTRKNSNYLLAEQ